VPTRRMPLVLAGALAFAAFMAALSPAARAQDATPVADTAAQAATPVAVVPVSRPVHIHAGDCTNLGEVIVPLNNLVSPVGDFVGQAEEATRVESSFTTVPLGIDAILGADHAINVHLSDAEIDTYLACGELGGIIDINGALIVGLREQNNSGYTGVAFLQPNLDGISTDVSVFISPAFGAAG
jgi:hypothetical protein